MLVQAHENFTQLSEWLSWAESCHDKKIDLTLERVRAVGNKLDILRPDATVITVAGTNGKGSCVAILESIYLAAGYKVAAFTSPYLFEFNEQIRLNGKAVSDEELITAFHAVEIARNGIGLTLFEFKTLVALVLFQEFCPDIMLLEVGLGGRFDATNIIDADVMIITSIALDHIDRLGNTREQIGYEKAGIMRAHKPVVLGDNAPPNSVIQHAHRIQANLYSIDQDFYYCEQDKYWHWLYGKTEHRNLPYLPLLTKNAASALMAINLLQERLPVAHDAISNGLKTVNLPGCCEVIYGDIIQVFDVAHNPAAVIELAAKLTAINCSGRIYAIFAAFKDKDIAGMIAPLKPIVDCWHISTVGEERSATTAMLAKSMLNANIKNFDSFPTPQNAYQSALKTTQSGDMLVVFGSFQTVAAAMNVKKS